jgi:Flp pilus assembly pilin Flp
MYGRFSVLLGRLWTVTRDDFKREDGQTVTEYGIVLGVLIVGLAITLGVFGTAIADFLTKVSNKISAQV